MNKDWLNDERWHGVIVQDTKDPKKAYCKVCFKSFVATSFQIIQKHFTDKTHQNNEDNKNSEMKNFFKPIVKTNLSVNEFEV